MKVSGFIYSSRLNIKDIRGVECRKNISNITPTDQILTPFGYRNIKTLYRFNINENLYKIYFNNKKSIIITQNYELPLYKDNHPLILTSPNVRLDMSAYTINLSPLRSVHLRETNKVLKYENEFNNIIKASSLKSYYNIHLTFNGKGTEVEVFIPTRKLCIINEPIKNNMIYRNYLPNNYSSERFNKLVSKGFDVIVCNFSKVDFNKLRELLIWHDSTNVTKIEMIDGIKEVFNLEIDNEGHLNHVNQFYLNDILVYDYKIN